LNKPAIKNSILEKITVEVDKLKIRTKDIETRLDDLEQYSRKTCLKFAGIPEREDEDTDEVVLNTIDKLVLLQEFEKLDKYSISVSHRLGKPRHDKPRDIIVRFVRYRDKATVYRLKSNLKGFNENPSFHK
jgi:hypothetical protein